MSRSVLYALLLLLASAGAALAGAFGLVVALIESEYRRREEGQR